MDERQEKFEQELKRIGFPIFISFRRDRKNAEITNKSFWSFLRSFEAFNKHQDKFKSEISQYVRGEKLLFSFRHVNTEQEKI